MRRIRRYETPPAVHAFEKELTALPFIEAVQVEKGSCPEDQRLKAIREFEALRAQERAPKRRAARKR